MFLTDREHHDVMSNMDDFLLHYNWLTVFSMKKGRCNYNLTIKFHMIWHLMHMGKYINPMSFWCYEFEDLIRQVVRSAKGCIAGTSMDGIAKKVLENYLLALSLALQWEMDPTGIP